MRSAVTSHIRGLMDQNDQNCPIRKQFVFDDKECLSSSCELTDPLREDNYSPVPGVIHRHKDRCLILPIMRCPAYCRFCFRKEVRSNHENFDLHSAFQYIKKQNEIREIIFSGGEPFLLKDGEIEKMIHIFASVQNIRFLRFHTRITLSQPDRVTESLIRILNKSPLQIIIVLHSNHVKELSSKAVKAIQKFRSAGCMMLSQSVLLKGVNDSYEALQKLFLALAENGVKPYYLHQLDRAPGTSHFFVSQKKGKKIMEKLRRNISGICIPRYVVDTGTMKQGKRSLF